MCHPISRKELMSSNTLLVVKAACAILVGALLIASPGDYTKLMAQIIGGVILVTGLVPMVGFWFPAPSGPTRLVFPVAGVGCVLLGLMLILYPGTFVRALMYMLAVLFLVGGVHQLVSQLSVRGMLPMRWGSLLLSLALVLLGVIILVYPMRSASVPFFLLGLGCIAYGAVELRRLLGRILGGRGSRHEDEYVDYEEIIDEDTIRK